MTNISRARLFGKADPRAVLLRYLAHAGSAKIDRAGRKTLARSLQIGADYKLELGLFGLWRRHLVWIDGDVVELVLFRTAAAG